jgi:hypothetical protein
LKPKKSYIYVYYYYFEDERDATILLWHVTMTQNGTIIHQKLKENLTASAMQVEPGEENAPGLKHLSDGISKYGSFAFAIIAI